MKQLAEIHTAFIERADDVSLLNTPAVNALRHKAKAQFERHGLPGKKQEDWKYTSLWQLGQEQFVYQAAETTLDAETIDRMALVSEAYRLVIIDGVFQPELSRLTDLPQGVKLQAMSQLDADIADQLNQQIDLEKPGFNALNTMLFSEGLYLHIANDIRLSQPIELVVVNSGKPANLAVHLRHLVRLEKGAKATLIEHYVSANDAATGLNDIVTEVALAQDAQLEHYKLQQESVASYHVATMAAHQAAGSHWHNANISLGGKLARNDVHSRLEGEAAHVTMSGLYLVAGDQHVDNHTRIDHSVANTSSDEVYKGVLDEKSHAVFNGKVFVHKDAQKTDANQSNHNLLLSRGCEIDTKPEMEIYADDVKCGHGSTVGQIDMDQLFFLRARGLDEVSARSLLTFAFAVDVLDRLPSDEIKQALSTVIEQRLPRGAKV